MSEFNGSKGFLYIPVGIAHDKELLKQPKSILLMGEIISMLNVTGKFFMSNRALAEKLGCTRRSIQNNLTYLQQHGYINRTIIYEDNDRSRVQGRLISAGPALKQVLSTGWGETDFTTPCNTFHQGGETDFTTPMKRVSPKENNIREQYKRSVKSLSQEREEKKKMNQYVVQEIGNYFADHGYSLNASEIKRMWPKVKGKNLQQLLAEADKALTLASDYPFGYFLTLADNLPKASNEGGD